MKQTHLIGLAAFGMLALAGCTTTSPNYGSSGYGSSAPYPSQARCADCGLVTRIDVVASNRSAPSATGAILGGIVGAVAGHEIAKRNVQCGSYPKRVARNSYQRSNCRWVQERYEGRNQSFEVCRGRDGVWRPSGRA